MDAQRGCLTDGDIRALLDAAVSEDVRASWVEHLSNCETCRERMGVVADNAGAIAAILGRINPSFGALDENEALRKVHARRTSREPASPLLKGDWLMSRLSGVGRRSALVGVAAVALMVAVVAAVPFSSLAENMLTRFRVQQFSAITIPMDLVQQEAQASQTMDSGTQAFVKAQLAGLGQLHSTLNRNSLTEASSVADAQTHLNGTFEVPTKLSDFANVQPTVYMSNAGTVSYDLNVQKARDLLTLGGIDPAPLPDPSTTPTVTITLDVPAGAGLDYVANGKHLVVAQMESPTLTIPSSVDISMLRDELLATGILPPDMVSQLRSVNDWEHTLIVPVPAGASSNNVTVQGSPGLLIKSDQGSAVMWQKDGILHIVGSNSNVDVMSIASSLH